ncbi:MAG: urea transporter [Byssovorax sp.]
MAQVKGGPARDKSVLVREAEGFLRVYAKILFSTSPAVGLLLCLATATVPRALLGGALAVLVANALARRLDFDRDSIDQGAYGYNALLLGLGISQSFAGPEAAFLIVLGALACVLITASLEASLGATVSLPLLTLPFLAIYPLVSGASIFVLGAVQTPHAGGPLALAPLLAFLPRSASLFLQSLGALFFLPRVDAGLLVLIALLVHSRIAALLAALAFTLILGLRAHLLSLPEAMADSLGYNAMLTALALGGVYFVPSTASFLLALLGALVTALLSLGLAAPLARLGLSPLIIPFNLTLLLTLSAMRRRTHDLSPKSVDFLPGTPEENLTYHKTRNQRFSALHAVTFHLPFRGAWLCTQAVDGPHTHQGIWRHAFDFEVRDEDQKLFRDQGTSPEHYHAYRLPVLASADGTVVEVENDVNDNPIGAMNLEQNWGNRVLIHHAPGLYSLVAHLAKGSVKVHKGQIVRRGDQLGLSGNSGRSPQPHLHFHLQSSDKTGGPTLPCRFNDAVLVRAGEPSALCTAHEPAEGEVLKNVDVDEQVAAFFGFDIGASWSFSIGKHTETITSEVDVYGRPLLRSLDRASTLFYGRSEETFTAWDAVGDERSVLHLLRAALPRVPFDGSEGMTWTDVLPARRALSGVMRVLFDFVSPFLTNDGLVMELSMVRKGASLVVEGRSRKVDGRGRPVLKTRAVLLRGIGPVEVEVVLRGKVWTALRAGESGRESATATATEGGVMRTLA